MAKKNNNKKATGDKSVKKVESPVEKTVETKASEVKTQEEKKPVEKKPVEVAAATPKIIPAPKKDEITLDVVTAKMLGKDSSRLSPDARVQLAALTDSRLQRGLIPENLAESLNYMVNMSICFESIRAYAQINAEGKEMGLLMQNDTAKKYAEELFSTFGISTKLLPSGTDGQTKIKFDEVPEEIEVTAKKEVKLAQQTTVPDISADMTEEEKLANITAALARKNTKADGMQAMAVNFIDGLNRVKKAYKISDTKEAMKCMLQKFTVFAPDPKKGGNTLVKSKSSLLLSCYMSMISGSFIANNELFTIFTTLRKNHFPENVLSDEELYYLITLFVSRSSEVESQENNRTFSSSFYGRFYDIHIAKHDVFIEKMAEIFAKPNEELNNAVDIYLDETFKVDIQPLKLKTTLAANLGIDLTGGDAVEAIITKMKSIATAFKYPVERFYVEDTPVEATDAPVEEVKTEETQKDEPAKEEPANETK